MEDKNQVEDTITSMKKLSWHMQNNDIRWVACAKVRLPFRLWHSPTLFLSAALLASDPIDKCIPRSNYFHKHHEFMSNLCGKRTCQKSGANLKSYLYPIFIICFLFSLGQSILSLKMIFFESVECFSVLRQRCTDTALSIGHGAQRVLAFSCNISIFCTFSLKVQISKDNQLPSWLPVYQNINGNIIKSF